VVRVFALANQVNTATPQVSVNFVNGSTTNTLTINATGSSVPLTVNTSDASSSWNMAVPAAWITAGTAVSADVDPANQIAESNKGNKPFFVRRAEHAKRAPMEDHAVSDSHDGRADGNGGKLKQDENGFG